MTSSLTRAKDTAASRAIPTRPKDTHVGENLAGARPGVVEMGFCLCLLQGRREATYKLQECRSRKSCLLHHHFTSEGNDEGQSRARQTAAARLPDSFTPPTTTDDKEELPPFPSRASTSPISRSDRCAGSRRGERSPTALPGRGIRIRIRRRDIKHSVKFCENCL